MTYLTHFTKKLSVLFIALLCFTKVLAFADAKNNLNNIISNNSIEFKEKLTEAEKSWLKEHNKVKVGVGIAWPPFQYLENGEFKGIVADYVQIISQRLGIQIEIIKNVSSFQEVIEMAKKRELDILACVTESPERKEFMSFTKPYISSSLVIVTAKDISSPVNSLNDLSRKKVAFAKALVSYSKIGDKFPDIIPYFVKTPLEELEAVSFGKAEACIQNLEVVSYFIQKKNLANLKVAAPSGFDNTDLSFATRNDWPLLLNILNKAVESITKEEHDFIYKKWITVEFEYKFNWVEILKWLLVFGSFLGVSIFWNRRLTKEIANRKKIEEILLESEARLRAISDNLPNGMVYQIDSGEYGDKRNFSYISAGVKKLHEVEVNEALNNSKLIYKQVLENFRDKIAHLEAIALANMEAFMIEVPICLPSGEIRWRLFTSAPRRLANNNLVWDGIEIDVTEQKQAEEALKESEEKYRSIFEGSRDGFVMIDLEGKFISCNNAYLNMLGYTMEELSKIDFYKITPKRWHDWERTEIVEKQLLKKGYASVYEKEYIRKDGTIFPVEIMAYKVVSLITDKTFLWGVVRDITDRKKAEEQICLSLKEKEILLREIHHRVKNNLSMIIGLIDMQASNLVGKLNKLDKTNKKQAFLNIDFFTELRERIWAIAHVHENLYHSNKLSHINFKDYIINLTNDMIGLYYSPNILIETTFSEAFLDVETAIPCGLIYIELLTNALKHAFPKNNYRKYQDYQDSQNSQDSQDSQNFQEFQEYQEYREIQNSQNSQEAQKIDSQRVILSTFKEEDNAFVLSVRDNGVGMPLNFDWRNAKSMGLRLINILVKQIDASLEVNVCDGTEFKITFLKSRKVIEPLETLEPLKSLKNTALENSRNIQKE